MPLDPVQAEEHHEAGPPPPFEPGPPFRPGPSPPRRSCTSLGRARGKGSQLERGPGSWLSRTVGGLGVGIPRAGSPTSRDPLPLLRRVLFSLAYFKPAGRPLGGQSPTSRKSVSRTPIGRTPRGSCNRTLLRRVLRRFSTSRCFLEGFLEGTL